MKTKPGVGDSGRAANSRRWEGGANSHAPSRAGPVVDLEHIADKHRGPAWRFDRLLHPSKQLPIAHGDATIARESAGPAKPVQIAARGVFPSAALL